MTGAPVDGVTTKLSRKLSADTLVKAVMLATSTTAASTLIVSLDVKVKLPGVAFSRMDSQSAPSTEATQPGNLYTSTVAGDPTDEVTDQLPLVTMGPSVTVVPAGGLAGQAKLNTAAWAVPLTSNKAMAMAVGV